MSTRAEKGTNADTRPSAGTLESTPDTPQADSVVGSTTAISSAAPASSAHDSVNGKTMSTSVDNGMAGSTTTASSSATPASSTHDSVDGKTNTFADKQINADAAPSVRTSDPTTERVGLSAGDTAVADGKETSPLSAGPQETITSPGNKESRAETPQQTNLPVKKGTQTRGRGRIPRAEAAEGSSGGVEQTVRTQRKAKAEEAEAKETRVATRSQRVRTASARARQEDPLAVRSRRGMQGTK
ncbi:hypothetical protein CERSUDRAFT_101207 [Gelatoporia subvermispora B]|uniref:Uncharacterized protein n=1 Tax=Ceriporiopsis subvermispora (strain B) TaxID=914234 RepID=M2Q191_CERS8|nr:hypothetical protein CERSUDRAFT_101207 [Gelatoporia subvermispora B]